MASNVLTHIFADDIEFIETPVCSFFGLCSYMRTMLPPKIPKTKAKKGQGTLFAAVLRSGCPISRRIKTNAVTIKKMPVVLIGNRQGQLIADRNPDDARQTHIDVHL